MKLDLSRFPNSPGVYLFKNKKGRILYVGKALNLKTRVSSHFQTTKIYEKVSKLLGKTASIETIPVLSELEALLLEAHLIKTHQPFFNTRAKDDKHPLYIKITINDEYPRLFMVRREEEAGSLYFGPFPSSQTVKRVLRFLRHIFPFDAQKTIGARACFWSQIGLCHPCPSVIESLEGKIKKTERAKYKKNIRRLVAVLSRKTDKVRRSLEKEMKKATREENFEQAAQIRDQINRLNYITREYHTVSSFLENPNLVADLRVDENKALEKLLSSHLKLHISISRIECFDASHTALVNPTVGMVTFVNGEPEKNLYRRFRIRDKVIPASPDERASRGGDDLSFLEEALRRRFTHKEWGIPDLVVIDGGKTQTKRALEVMRELGIKIPVVGLVKPFDNLVIPHLDARLPARLAKRAEQGFQIVKIKDKSALSLLQRLRDEAHRFAGAYHRKLRTKLFLAREV